MAATLLPTGGIALHGAPDSDIGSKDSKPTPLQAMQVEMPQEIVDELLESVRSGKMPQLSFGQAPQIKYGDKTHALQSSPESHRHELYQSSSAGSDDSFEFAGLMNHSLSVEEVTSGVDSALEQLKSSMAAISEVRQANKTTIGNVTPMRTPGHRRFPSKGVKPQHLGPSSMGSPLLSGPTSPMAKRPPTSQPGSSHEVLLNALRTPLIHLLAVQSSKDTTLAETCRAPIANVRDLLPKIATRSLQDTDKWQLKDKSFRDLKPWKFAYKSAEDREQAIDNAIKSFDRLRLAKDHEDWQMLLPREERGQGKCLSRLTVKAPEARPATPLHKMPKLTDKKPAAKKNGEKVATGETKKAKEKTARDAEPKPKKVVKEKTIKERTAVKDERTKTANAAAPASTSKSAAPSKNNTPSTGAPKIRTKKVPTAHEGSSAPRVKSKMPVRDLHKDRAPRPPKPQMPANTKPKNPSPLSASPPVNASDFEDNHPVHKALSAAPSPAKAPSGNSDRMLKRKANDLDSDIHNHNVPVKRNHVDRTTPNHTPSSTNGRINGSTPSSTNSVKRKSDESSTSNTPASSNKIRKVTSIDTSLASRYPHHHSQRSPGESSSSTTSPAMPSLSFRQTVELSQRFQKYYKKYEELYWKLTEAETPPNEGQRNELLKMHKKLEEMKREIKAGAVVHR